MLNRATTGYAPVRTLPLRSEKLYGNSPSGVITQTHVWFTPEAIILDALSVLTESIVIWRIFVRNLPLVTFRISTLTLLLILAFGMRQQPNLALANSYSTGAVEKTPVQISANITAGTKPVYIWPVQSHHLTSYFSFYHKGIDMPAAYGSPVKPFSNGKVVFAGWDGGFGQIVIIRHKDGLLSKYAHLSAINVRKDQRVGRNKTIGHVGTTGIATGSHLHFEIHIKSGAIDPLNLLP
jgi:murein DD-endopeptidase MepM/ murein hydrolase activator NlpD